MLELMIVIAIATILATAAVPAMRGLVLDSGQRSLANELLASLQLARSEAIRRGHEVRVCPSTNQQNCSTSRNDWNEGWLVEAPSVNGNPREVLYTARNERAGHDISADQDAITFLAFPASVDEGLSVLTVCDQRGAAHARRVVVQPSGQSSVRTDGAAC